MDKEQQEVVSLVQHYPRVAVASGTARGKDYVAACVSLAFYISSNLCSIRKEN